MIPVKDKNPVNTIERRVDLNKLKNSFLFFFEINLPIKGTLVLVQAKHIMLVISAILNDIPNCPANSGPKILNENGIKRFIPK